MNDSRLRASGFGTVLLLLGFFNFANAIDYPSLSPGVLLSSGEGDAYSFALAESHEKDAPLIATSTAAGDAGIGAAAVETPALASDVGLAQQSGVTPSVSANAAPVNRAPPVISNVASGNLSPTTATIKWQTDQPCDSQVEFGPTAAYGLSSPRDTARVTAHAVILTGLTPGTSYHFRVLSADSAGSVGRSDDFTFTTSVLPHSDDFNGSSLDPAKWQIGAPTQNFSVVTDGSLRLRSASGRSGWIYTTERFSGRDRLVWIKVVRPNDDGALGLSPTVTPASEFGLYNEANWYRFYNYRNRSDEPYRLHVQWNKNGIADGFDVAAGVRFERDYHLRLRTAADSIFFEYSFDGEVWAIAYTEIFSLPGYTLDSLFVFELAAYSTPAKGEWIVDDFLLGSSLPAAADTMSPVIIAVASSELTRSSAVLTWNTDEACDAQVEYGLTETYGFSSPVTAAMATTHRVLLSGLQEGMRYHFRVKSRDQAGNLSARGDFTFATPDQTPPVIANVRSDSITATTAQIAWETNEASDAQVEFGLSTSYGSTSPALAGLATAHRLTLTGLQEGVTYHYRVKSRDGAGNLSTSEDFTFTTLDLTPPAISNLTVSGLTPVAALITWNTNEAGDAQVEYGLSPAYGFATRLETALVTAHAVQLVDLAPATTYHCRVKSADRAGNLSVSDDFTFTTPNGPLWADDFSGAGLNPAKWQLGTNPGNAATVEGGALRLRSTGSTSAWLSTRDRFVGRNKIIQVRVIQPNDDGALGMSPTVNPASPYGFYNEANWYRFYNYRNSSAEPYKLHVQWNKAGVSGGRDVANGVRFDREFHLRLRTTTDSIAFEYSFDNIAWQHAYAEAFSLPGYSLNHEFAFELAAYNTPVKGEWLVDDFAVYATEGLDKGDASAPQLFNINVAEVEANRALITWQTNEASDAQVEYGLTETYGSLSPLAPGLRMLHTVALTDLSPGTTYHYRVKSRDAAGNLAVSRDSTFRTEGSALRARALLADSLAGRTAGSRTGGVFLPEGGWQATAAEDMITYDLGFYVENGALELEVRNFSPKEQNSFPRHHIVSMFRNPWGNHHPVENQETVWDLHAGSRYNPGVKMLSWAYDQQERNTTILDDWSRAQTYRLKVTWEGNRLSYYRDGVLQATHTHAAPMQLRYVFLGRDFTVGTDLITGFKNNQYGAMIGPIYSNLIVTANLSAEDETPPQVSGITIRDRYANGVRLAWSTNEAAVCFVEYGATTAFSQKTKVLGPPDSSFSVTLADLRPNQTYYYRITAVDNAGNRFTSGTQTFITMARGLYVFKPSADTYVETAGLYATRRDYGNYGWMNLGAGKGRECYLRFAVAGLDSAIVSAALRLHGRQSGIGGNLVRALNTAWEENSVTWLSKPVVAGAVLDTLSIVQEKEWHSANVTAAVTGNGTFDFALIGSGPDFVSFDSRESPNAQPELIIAQKGYEASIPSVPLYGVHEIMLNANQTGTNPYLDGPAVTVTFTGVDGAARGQTLSLNGFWDGGSVYRVRLSPPAWGEWQWSSSSSEAGLHGKTGRLVCEGRLPAGHANAGGPLRQATAFPYSLETTEGRPVFLLGDTQWSFASAKISWPVEFKTYVDARAAQGFNYVHGQLYALRPDSNDFNEGGQAFINRDVDRLNPGYWQAFDRRLAYLNEMGLTAGLMFAWANEGWQRFATSAQVDRYVQYLINRYAAYNLIWILAGEYEEAAVPGGYDRLGEFVKSNDPYRHPITTHTIDTNADDFGTASWLTAIYQQVPDPSRITTDRRYNKPVINSEFGYEGDQSAEEVRQDAWEIVMRGGFLVYGNTTTFHHNAVMSQANLYSAGARFMTLLKNFWTNNGRYALNWWRYSRFEALPNERWLAGLPGAEYVVYVENALPFRVNLGEASGTLSGQWFNTRTGEWSGMIFGAASDTFALTPPGAGYAAFLSTGTSSSPSMKCQPSAAPATLGLPECFELAQNYPNPFRSETAIKLALPEQGRVEAVVYDLAGREVTRLYDGNLPPGYHVLRWSGNHTAGESLSSGIYLLRVIYTSSGNGREVMTKRVLYLK